MPEIKGDYGGILKTIKATADAKLETVSAIEAGTNVIGNIDRVATVGQIDHLGTVEHVNQIDYLGTVKEGRTYGWDGADWQKMLTSTAGYLLPRCGHDGMNPTPLRTNPQGRLELDTLGTVEHVNRIESLGTVNNIPYVYDRDLAGFYYLLAESIGLCTSPGINSGTFMPLAVNAGGKLKTAPATSRKGVVQTVANAGTAVALVASSTPCIGVICKAVHENLGTVYVGDSTVDDTHGFQLRRDEFISFSCQNAGSVFIDASRNAQKVSAFYINY